MTHQTTGHSLISVVVPVYNVRPYLQRCFESLRQQTYTHLEVIFVDDCSTDGSYEECLRLCTGDHRFRVLRQPANSGAGDARQRGIEAAAGTWIGFADGDDLAEPELFATLHRMAEQTGADIACCNAFYAFEDGRKRPIFPPSDTVISLTPKEALLRMHRHRGIGYSLWDKLFRRDILLQNPMHTQPFEDQATLPFYFRAARRIALCATPLYHYIQHEGSLMHGKFDARKEFTAFELFYRETRLLETEYGVQGLNTVVKKGVHFLNHLCLLPPSAQTADLYQKTSDRIHEYDGIRIRPYGLALRLKRYLLLHHYAAYRQAYLFFMRLFKPAKYRHIRAASPNR